MGGFQKRSPTMFEALFPGPIALARHRTSPLADERRQFLQHLHDLGYARLSLKAVACELVVITRYLDLSSGVALAGTIGGTGAARRAGVPTAARRLQDVHGG